MENRSCVGQVVPKNGFDAEKPKNTMQFLPWNGVVMGRREIHE
jgi:hypothetical protein